MINDVADAVDPNLRLSILAVLMDLGAIPRPTRHQIEREHPADEHGLRATLLAHLNTMPIADDLFARVRSLSIRGGGADERVTELVFPGHASDERFKATSLSGLERCTGLERVELYECTAPDLSPLRALRALRELVVTWGPDMELAALMNEGLIRDLARGVAVEVEAPEMVDAEREPRPGDDVGDLNLKLVLLESLASRELIPWPDARRILDQVGRPDDDDDDDVDASGDGWMYVYNYEAAAALGAMVTDELLDSIVELSINPPLRLAMIVFPQWDGEDDQFDVERLDGIECCTKLRRLELDQCRVSDLSPLLGLPALERVEISWHADIDRRAAAWREARQRNRRVIEKLEQRGVKTQVKW